MRGPEEMLEEAALAIRAGEVVGVPTETVYGLAVDPFRDEAVRVLFEVKKRPESTPLPVLVSEPAEAERYGELSDAARRLAEVYWPGPLTLVVPRRAGLGLHLGGDEETVGLRCPARELTRELIAMTGGVLAVTSANVHDMAPATTAEELRQSLGRSVRVILDGGACGGVPSTVVSLVGNSPVVLREGAIAEVELASYY